MSQRTEHYGLMRLGAGDQFSENGYQFTDADRVLIDRILWLMGGGHIHSGTAGSGTTNPASGPTRVLSNTGGVLPAGTRVYYKITLVDSNGNETEPSPEVFTDTPASIVSPAAPALSTATTGGSLLPGQYTYVLSAYQTTSTSETKALNHASITIPTGTSTNTVTLTLPTRPTGATGFNVYRRAPGGIMYYFLASTTSTTTYVDTGAVTENCNRTLPGANTTFSTNKITLTYPGGTVPAGHTWKIYRTFVTGNYGGSLLKWVVEETTEGSGVITPNYDDVGNATGGSSPPTANQTTFSNPSKIQLTDGENVQGKLPTGFISGFPFVVSFSFEGQLAVQTGRNLWVCEFPKYRIIACRASLGVGSSPVSTAVIVDVNKGTGTTPTPTTVYTTQANRPQVAVGQRIGTRTVPNTIELVVGDSLSVDIDQIGGGATPNDRNLTVNVYGWAYGFTETTTLV